MGRRESQRRLYAATALTLPGDPTTRTSAGGAGALHFESGRGAARFADGVSFGVVWHVVDLAGNTIREGVE